MPTVRPIAAVLALVLVAGCTSTLGSSQPDGTGTRTSTSDRSSVGRPSAAVPPTGATVARTALAELARVAVKGRAPSTGYTRAQFGQAWTDDTDDLYGHNGCDTRNDILRRDLVDQQLKPGTHGCVVLTGTLHDPYTGATISFRRGVGSSLAVQIDHVVALGDAWQKGAQSWTPQRRTDFANDPLNLLAVDGPTNEGKGDGDAATWLPPRTAFRCAYVARQVAVTARYGLWMTAAEHATSERILATCAR